MRSLAIPMLVTIALLAAAPDRAVASARQSAGIWEIDYSCAPGTFGYVRNLEQLVEAIEQRSRVLPVDYSVKLDGDTVRVFDGRRIYVYRFIGDTGLRIIRYSQLEDARNAASPSLPGGACG